MPSPLPPDHKIRYTDNHRLRHLPTERGEETENVRKPDSKFRQWRIKYSKTTEKLFSITKPGYTPKRSLSSRVASTIVRVLSYFYSTRKPFNNPSPELTDWMSRTFTGYRKNTRIMNCTMIGSHDSATHCLKGLGQSWAVTQTNGIKDQLHAGARYLDIRITLDHQGKYIVHHGPVKGGSAQEEVAEPLLDFLKNHPKEVVVVKLQFSGMNKAQVKQYLEKDFHILRECFALHNHDLDGNQRAPGEITFAEAQASSRNLLLTVSDEHLKKDDKLTQKDLGKTAWLHRNNVIDEWPNTPDAKDVFRFNEERLDKIKIARKNGKLAIVQMQTNVNPWQTLKGGLSSIRRLAGFSNRAIPTALRQWYLAKDFSPNIILQDFIGHFNYRELAIIALTYNTSRMSLEELEKAFPELGPEILDTRYSLGLFLSK